MAVRRRRLHELRYQRDQRLRGARKRRCRPGSSRSRAATEKAADRSPAAPLVAKSAIGPQWGLCPATRFLRAPLDGPHSIDRNRATGSGSRMAICVATPHLGDLHMLVFVRSQSMGEPTRTRSPIGSICRSRLSRPCATTWKPQGSLRSNSGAEKGVFTPPASNAPRIRRNVGRRARLCSPLRGLAAGGVRGECYTVRLARPPPR
jgi:hypothetical protein